MSKRSYSFTDEPESEPVAESAPQGPFVLYVEELGKRGERAMGEYATRQEAEANGQRMKDAKGCPVAAFSVRSK